MKKRRFQPRSAAKNNKTGCDNSGLPLTEKTSHGEIFLELTAIPKDIQDMANAMFRESDQSDSKESSK